MFMLHAKPFPALGVTAVVAVRRRPDRLHRRLGRPGARAVYVLDRVEAPRTTSATGSTTATSARDAAAGARSIRSCAPRCWPTSPAMPGEGAMSEERQRPPAEVLHADELARLAEHDGDAPRPPGWRLTPASVVAFVRGDAALGIAPKFVGSRAFVERCVVALATNRGLMLIGEPGTAKSCLTELLAAAISGDSTLTIQGSAGTTEDQIKYSWNYALLLAEGPIGALAGARAAAARHARGADRALRGDHALPARGAGLAAVGARATACWWSRSSTRAARVFARAGLQRHRHRQHPRPRRQRDERGAQAPLQLRDRAADRRHRRRAGAGRARDGPGCWSARASRLRLPEDLAEVLVTTFHELRSGQTAGGKAIEPLTSAMSTAEAVSVGFAAVRAGALLRRGRAARRARRAAPGRHRAQGRARGRQAAAPLPRARGPRAAADGVWKDLYAARALLA